MKSVVVIEIPVPNYYGDGIFYQQLLFNHSPTKEYVIEVLERLHKESLEYVQYDNGWVECIKTVKSVPDDNWEFVAQGDLVHTNTFVSIFGPELVPFNWKVVDVFGADIIAT